MKYRQLHKRLIEEIDDGTLSACVVSKSGDDVAVEVKSEHRDALRALESLFPGKPMALIPRVRVLGGIVRMKFNAIGIELQIQHPEGEESFYYGVDAMA